MKLLDLFAGIGGFSLAAHWLGWQTAAFVERDEFCQKVLRKNFGDIPIHDDIFTFSGHELTDVLERDFSPEELLGVDMAAKRKDYDAAVQMYEKGMSIQEIAKFYDMSRQAMWAILKRRGCVFRDNKKYGEENHFYRGTKADDRAHDIVEKAIKRGALVPKSECEICGSSGAFKDGRNSIQAHHDDYNKPLEVRWLCQKCHHNWHKENQAIPLKEAQGSAEVNRLYSIDILTGGFP